MRCFWTHGYEGTSLDRLERATGLGRQSLYNAFGDKQALFSAALDRYRAEVADPLASVLDADEPLAAVRAYLDAQVRLLEDDRLPAGCLIAASCNELGGRPDALGDRVRSIADAGRVVLQERFRTWRAEGKLARDADPDALAALLGAIVRGFAVMAAASNDPSEARRAADGAMVALAPLFGAMQDETDEGGARTPDAADD